MIVKFLRQGGVLWFLSDGKALEQIKEKKYYEQLIGKFKEIYLIGIEFSKLERNIVGFELEKVL